MIFIQLVNIVFQLQQKFLNYLILKESRTGCCGVENANLIPWQASNWQSKRLGLNLCFQELGKSRPQKLPATWPEARTLGQQQFLDPPTQASFQPWHPGNGKSVEMDSTD